MNARGLWQVSVITILLAAAGCYRPFSPEQVRHEIERQTGAEPKSSFEFKLGGATMKLAKVVASKASGEPVNFGGLTRIDLAVFELPPAKRVDFNSMRIWGWDKLIETQEGELSLMVLVRTNGKTLGDLVLVAQGRDQVLYGRLKGRLDPNLPTALQKVLRATGLQGLKERILSAAGENPADTAPPSSSKPAP